MQPNPLSEKSWIHPIIDLLNDKEYGEAYCLADYYPATLERNITQSIALIGQKDLLRANLLIKKNLESFLSLRDFVNKMLQLGFIPNEMGGDKFSSSDPSEYIETILIVSKLILDPLTIDESWRALYAIVAKPNCQDKLLINSILTCLYQIKSEPEKLLNYAEIVVAKCYWDRNDSELKQLGAFFLAEAISTPDIKFTLLAHAAEIIQKNYPLNLDQLNYVFDRILIIKPDGRKWVLSKYQFLFDSYGLEEYKTQFLDKSIFFSKNLRDFIVLETRKAKDQIQLLIQYQQYKYAKWYVPGDEMLLATAVFLDTNNKNVKIELILQLLKYENTPNDYFAFELFAAFLDLFFKEVGRSAQAYLIRFYTIKNHAKHFEQLLLSINKYQHFYKKYTKKSLIAFLEHEEQKENHRESYSLGGDVIYSIGGVKSVSGILDYHVEIGSDFNIKMDGEIATPKENVQEMPSNEKRFTFIDFPSKCQINKKVQLRVQLTKAIPSYTRVLKQLDLLINSETREICLEINISAKGFALRDWHKQLRFLVSEDSEIAVFDLVALDTGKHAIEIEFFFEAARVGYVIVETEVGYYLNGVDTPSDFKIIQDPLTVLAITENHTASVPKYTLNVLWMEKERKLSYRVLSIDSEQNLSWEKMDPPSIEQISDYQRDLNAFLYEVATQANPNDDYWDSISVNMQGLGNTLFLELIPAELAILIKKWPPDTVLIVSTNEQWIPWELIFDGEDFWGSKFIVARHPRITLASGVPEKDRHQGNLKQKINRVVNVIGGGVPKIEAERARHLFDTIISKENIEILTEQPVSVFSKALLETDAIHCTCHGHLEPHMLQIALDKSRILNLPPDTIKLLPLKQGSMVFANACSSSAPILKFGRFSSFGWEFYLNGADVFIGTLGAVPITYAISFAEDVYKELFSGDSNVGQAVLAAKRTATKKRNLFWLFYCIYGDPFYSVN